MSIQFDKKILLPVVLSLFFLLLTKLSYVGLWLFSFFYSADRMHENLTSGNDFQRIKLPILFTISFYLVLILLPLLIRFWAGYWGSKHVKAKNITSALLIGFLVFFVEFLIWVIFIITVIFIPKRFIYELDYKNIPEQFIEQQWKRYLINYLSRFPKNFIFSVTPTVFGGGFYFYSKKRISTKHMQAP